MIPNIIHFIYGLEKDFGGKPFSFIHYLSVLTASIVNNPETIYFHYQYEPEGEWWIKAKKHLTLKQIVPKDEIFGNKLYHFAHKADVARLEILQEYGGIYLDMDVICINSFAPLLKYNCVLGREENVGLCNAVILAKKESKYLSVWYEQYRNFNGDDWDEHSVRLPLKLAKKYPNLIHIKNEYAFFYPMFDDQIAKYLWSNNVSFSFIEKIIMILKKINRKLKNIDKGLNLKPIFHELFNSKWHYHKLKRSYCIHLWESLWWDKYLKSLSIENIKNKKGNFGRVVHRIVEADIN